MHRRILLIILLTFSATVFGRENSFCRNTDGQIQKTSDMNENFKTLSVKKIDPVNKCPDANEIEKLMNECSIEYNPIDIENWEGYGYDAQIKFRIAYSCNEIYIQYLVKEPDIKAVYDTDKDSKPYTDSCCELFVSINGDQTYYNLELNCIGKGTFAYHGKDSTIHFQDDIMSQIRRTSSLGDKAIGTIKGNEGVKQEWKLTVALPIALLRFASGMQPGATDSNSAVSPQSLKGCTVRANFYKCGDNMPVKHYFSWNPIKTPKPNFHTPQYFGYLKFE